MIDLFTSLSDLHLTLKSLSHGAVGLGSNNTIIILSFPPPLSGGELLEMRLLDKK